MSPQQQQRTRRLIFFSLLAIACGIVLLLMPGLGLTPGLLIIAAGIGFLIPCVIAFVSPSPDAVLSAAAQRRFTRRFIVTQVVWFLTIILSLFLLDRFEPGTLRTLAALLPTIPILMLLHAIAGLIHDMDELQRRIELESIVIGTAIVGLGYTMAGLLQFAHAVQVNAGLALILVFPLIFTVYGLVKLFVQRRYL